MQGKRLEDAELRTLFRMLDQGVSERVTARACLVARKTVQRWKVRRKKGDELVSTRKVA